MEVRTQSDVLRAINHGIYELGLIAIPTKPADMAKTLKLSSVDKYGNKRKGRLNAISNLNSNKIIENKDLRIKRVYDDEGVGWWVKASDKRPAEYRDHFKKTGPHSVFTSKVQQVEPVRNSANRSMEG